MKLDLGSDFVVEDVKFNYDTMETEITFHRSSLSYFYREWLTGLIVIFVVIGRLTIEPRLTNIPTWNLTYEAFAHIAVGFLLGGWFATRDRLPLYAMLGLTAFEVAMFVIQKMAV